ENKFIVELKCPMSAVKFKRVGTAGVPTLYYPQVQYQLGVAHAVWGITKAYFACYYPDGAYVADYTTFKEEIKTLILVETDYDPEYFEKMTDIITEFKRAVDTDVFNKQDPN